MPELNPQEQQGKQQQLTGLVLEQDGRSLLVPNTAVAELVAWQLPAEVPGGVRQDDGLIGSISWRGQQLPLVSFEVLGGEAEPDVTETARIAIFNRLDPSAGLEFYAALLQGIPRSLQVDSRLCSSHEPLRNGESAAVQLDGRLLFIPDLEGLEHKLIRARLQQRF